MISMKTRAKGVPFSYEKTAGGDIRIRYGRGREKTVSSEDLQQLIRHFKGRQVQLGTSRDRPPVDSVGEWLQQNVMKTAIASYIGPILVHEGYATWVDDSTLQFSG